MNKKTALIALFKAEVAEKLTDPYVEALKVAGIAASVVSTLEFNFIQEKCLQGYLENSQDFSGIIFTSPRTVEAVHRICAKEGINVSNWRGKRNYCVGGSTSTAAKLLLQLDVLGAESGNSEKLCSLILSEDCISSCTPYLYPCGNMRKDTLPNILSANGINLTEVVCYETICNSHLKDCWKKFVDEQGLPNILVFFSPSGVEFSHEMIKESYERSPQPEFIAIGPSTEQALLQINLKPCKVAIQPNPKAVFDSINSLFEH